MANADITVSTQDVELELEQLRNQVQALEAKNGRLLNVFDHSNDAIFLVNPAEDLIIDANAKASELLGYSNEEFITMKLSDPHPEDNVLIQSFLSSVMEDGYGWTDELTCITKDNTPVALEISASTTIINGQKHIVSILRDIRKRIERQSQINAMATFAELNPAPVMRLNRQGVIVSANPAAVKYFPEIDILGAQWAKICAEIDADKIEELFKTGDSYQHACDLIDKNLVFQYQLVPGGDEIHIYGFDITKQRIAEDALRESEMKLSGLLKTAPDAVIITNENGKIIMANDQTETMFGYDQSELIDQPVEILLSSEIRSKHKQHRDKYYQQTKIRRMGYDQEIFGQHKDGTKFPIESGMSPMETKDGVIVMNIIRDISVRKQAEAKLIAMNESLELRVTERTDELQQSLGNMQSTLDSAIYAMARIVETKDPYTAGHQRRVSQLAEEIAKQMNLPDDQVLGICMAGLIHDIGKIYVPSEILNKPGKLSQPEMQLIQLHPQMGADIVSPISFPWPVTDVILQHHEKLDGSGYPNGISGDEMLLEAKIIAVADVVEAMSSHRPYRPALGVEAALHEIRSYVDVYYDREIVEIIEDLFRNKNFEFKSS